MKYFRFNYEEIKVKFSRKSVIFFFSWDKVDDCETLLGKMLKYYDKNVIRVRDSLQ